MITLGVDLAVQCRDTGVCRLEWEDRRVTATFARPRTDDELLDLIADRGVTVGIDVPLGWPKGFADAVGSYMAGPTGRWTDGPWDPRATYHRLRRTDLEVTEHGKCLGLSLHPMSVAADKLGAPAMKAAWMLSELARRDDAFTVDRSGVTGRVVEVYPTAAIRVWKLGFDHYRNRSKGAARRALEQCRAALRCQAGFRIDGLDGIGSEHELDALVCALVARAARCDLTCPPAADQVELAAVEGWIHVPIEGSLGALASAEPERHECPCRHPVDGGPRWGQRAGGRGSVR